MSSKGEHTSDALKKTPPPSTMMTRRKAAQTQRQLRNKDRTMTKITQLLKRKRRTSTKTETQAPTKKDVKSPKKSKVTAKSAAVTPTSTQDGAGLTAVKRQSVEDVKKKVKSVKIGLKPRQNLKVLYKINKRKRTEPCKGLKLCLQNEASITEMENVLNSNSDRVESPDIIDLILNQTDLSDEDMMEIVTCPSPVWWELPPDSGFYDEDPIPMAKSLLKTSTSNTSNAEALMNTLKSSSLQKKEVIKKSDVEKFFKKKVALENLLSNLRDKKTFPTETESLAVDNKVDICSPSPSTSSADDFLLALADDDELLKGFENIEIPMKSSGNSENQDDSSCNSIKIDEKPNIAETRRDNNKEISDYVCETKKFENNENPTREETSIVSLNTINDNDSNCKTTGFENIESIKNQISDNPVVNTDSNCEIMKSYNSDVLTNPPKSEIRNLQDTEDKHNCEDEKDKLKESDINKQLIKQETKPGNSNTDSNDNMNIERIIHKHKKVKSKEIDEQNQGVVRIIESSNHFESLDSVNIQDNNIINIKDNCNINQAIESKLSTEENVEQDDINTNKTIEQEILNNELEEITVVQIIDDEYTDETIDCEMTEQRDCETKEVIITGSQNKIGNRIKNRRTSKDSTEMARKSKHLKTDDGRSKKNTFKMYKMNEYFKKCKRAKKTSRKAEIKKKTNVKSKKEEKNETSNQTNNSKRQITPSCQSDSSKKPIAVRNDKIVNYCLICSSIFDNDVCTYCSGNNTIV